MKSKFETKIDYSKIDQRTRKYIARKVLKQMRKDVTWLMKPRPIWLPYKIWFSLLTNLLYLDNKSIKKICSGTSLEIKTNKTKKQTH